jgi:hypothetical protein
MKQQESPVLYSRDPGDRIVQATPSKSSKPPKDVLPQDSLGMFVLEFLGFCGFVLGVAALVLLGGVGMGLS